MTFLFFIILPYHTPCRWWCKYYSTRCFRREYKYKWSTP